LKPGDLLRRQPRPVIPVQNIETDCDVPDVLDGPSPGFVVPRLELCAVIEELLVVVRRHRRGGENLRGRVLERIAALYRQKDDGADQRVPEEQDADAQIRGQAGEERLGPRLARLAEAAARLVALLRLGVPLERIGGVFALVGFVAVATRVLLHGRGRPSTGTFTPSHLLIRSDHEFRLGSSSASSLGGRDFF
jgi:hypothetical protein